MGWFSWLKIPKYARLDTVMSFNLLFGGPGFAAIRWHLLAPHPTLSETQMSIALATLQYAHILVVHNETRSELLDRVGNAALGLMAGDAVLNIAPWHLEVAGRQFQLWPWILGKPEEVSKPKTYVATLIQPSGGTPRLLFKMALGSTRVLAPSAALIPLYVISTILSDRDRTRLGQTLKAVNKYYGTLGAARLNSEPKALLAAMPVLTA